MSSSTLVADLKGLTDEQRVISDPSELYVYDCDGFTIARSTPGAVVFPMTTAEVVGIMRLLSERDIQIVPRGTGFSLHNRGALFTLEDGHPNLLAPRKRPLHTIIPAFMEKGDTRIGFGIMGGFNQAQAHAQFVANLVDYGFDIQQALEAGRFTKRTFDGADVTIEALVPEGVREELIGLGHDVTTIPPRTGTFGHGQAVMSDGSGVHFGASEPRHDGAAIPEAPAIFPR